MAEKLILIRHGALAAASAGRFVGSTDAGLSAAGRRQAAAVGGYLVKLGSAQVIVSPLRRTVETAELAVKSTGQAFRVDEGLREIDFGAWEKKTFEEICQEDSANAARWGRFEKDFAFPGGESLQSFIDRIGNLALRIASDPAQTVLAITHGGVIRFLICHFLGLEPRHYLLFNVDFGSISAIDLFDGAGVLTRLNDVCHLEEIHG
ncbi:MAG TPA: histidine phosphatase family protein [Smithellaceae bacterium]|nr:histidine phosphatase family protein [Smithellaceae bacterium]